MEGRQIFNLVKHEQPQTISFLLSYLDSAKSAEVFALLGPDLREEVIELRTRIEAMEQHALQSGEFGAAEQQMYELEERVEFVERLMSRGAGGTDAPRT